MENSVAAAKSLQSCPTLCDAIDGSPPSSPVPEIFQARTLAWVAIASSNAWKWKVKVKSLSCVWLLATPWTAAYQVPPSMRFLGKSTGVGCHCLLREEQCGDSCKKKMEKELPYGPAIPLLGIHTEDQNWKRHMYPSVHRSTVYNSQDMEAT